MTARLQAAQHRAAAPATILDLHAAIKLRLADPSIAAAFWMLSDKTGADHAPTIVDGWLPPKTPTATATQFPFLIVRPRVGVDSQQGADQDALATVDVVIGTYSDTDDGWFDVARVIEAIRHSLAERPALEHTAFEHTGPLSWEIEEEPARPQWLGTVTTVWTIPRPRRAPAKEE